MKRKPLILIAAVLTGFFGCGTGNKKHLNRLEPLDYEVMAEVVTKHWDGEFNWTQARVAAIPGMGNDGAKEQPALGWQRGEDNIIVGICDFTPGWHEETGKVLALGHTVYYVEGGKLLENRPRSTAYAVYDPETNEWSAWKQMKFPDENKFYNSGSGCGQWLIKPDGDLLVPAYFKAKGDTTKCYASTILHCRFDGEELSYIQHGDELSLDEPRGLYEPSLTVFKNRYYLTLRNDKRAYVTVSDNAMHWQPVKPWTFDNGLEIGSYNTQQHWAVHKDGLFLVYTRRGANNDHIPRSRG